ncbi:putative ABC transporter ATP-binding protein [Patulibacter medicamentivorans]|uniref:Putative ABC transporter ATP-binding protein n=1 Tax=Patulibacter medicamentivorans TaxID=1097667 RepID=H0E6X7_9ACTN|nr:ABC transporter ATP-binding protein [Patulibacter medicamentivorans]EHN10559.1 putative ABC transporter ATP-binding protein [Patulibacter medicamentivorans]
MSAAVTVEQVSKRYGARWALQDCTLEVPTGSVTALVGPNGAGKTTLLHLLVGLTEPTEGRVSVLGASPRTDPTHVLPRIGFVAQDHPLEPRFRVDEMLAVGRRLNPRWDESLARDWLRERQIPLADRVGALSGGQRAQVALALAIAKRPEVMVLDEPAAALDPLARREFLQSLMEAVAERELTVLMSSHLLADLERVCDHLVVLAAGGVQLVGPIDEIAASHRLLVGPPGDEQAVARVHQVVHARHTPRQTTLLVRANGHVYDARWQIEDVALEDVVLAYLQRRPDQEVAA